MINHHHRLGVIGPNGAGKSSLLRILAGLENPDQGEIILRKGIRVSYVPQRSEFDLESSVYQTVYEHALDQGLTEDECQVRTQVILGKSGFEDMDTRVGTLSGGWRKRLTLARGFVTQAELILLDEPTNHLDIEGILWLEGFLGNASFAWILVTHDRYFLQRTSRQTMELNTIFEDGMLILPEPYVQYLERRDAYLKANAQRLQALKGKVRKESAWLGRNPKARATKARFRVKAAEQLIQELDDLKARQEGRARGLTFSASERQTKKLVEVRSLEKSFGEHKIVSDFNLILRPGQRLGLLGRNGSGKTTLMKLIAGTISPDRGSVIHAPDLGLVVFQQTDDAIEHTTVERALSETGNQVIYCGRPVHVAAWANRFGIAADQLSLPVSELSGGERAKLRIARLMLQRADVLLLDEPTNDLDMATLDQLELGLMGFPGALVLVTHDRFMLSRVCREFIGLDGTGQCHKFGSYEQWERSLSPERKKTGSTERRARPKTKVRLSYHEQREFDEMEDRILSSEEEVGVCRKRMEDPSIACDAQALQEAYEALHAAELETQRLYERWSELEAKLNP